MALRKIDIGNEMKRGWQLFQPNMGLLILASVIACVVSGITFGILGGPLMVGLLLVIRRLSKNDVTKPQAGDVFKGLDFFVQALLVLILSFVANCILAFIPVVGQLAALIVGAVSMWAFAFVAFQKLTAIDAIKKIIEHTKNGEFTMPLLFAIIVSIISGLGVIACGIGIFFTLPLGYCMLVSCYETLFGDEPEVIDPISIQPPPPIEG